MNRRSSGCCLGNVKQRCIIKGLFSVAIAMFFHRCWAFLGAFLGVLLFSSSLCFGAFPIAPAQAAIHTYPETETQTMYRSRLSLRDNQDLAWQAILFKRIRDGLVVDFKLRLVGFPGQVAVAHPANVVLRQGMNQAWQAPDETEADAQLQTVVNGVGQYDMTQVMAELDRSAPMDLEVTLEGGEVRSFLVPPFVVKEWLKLKDMP